MSLKSQNNRHNSGECQTPEVQERTVATRRALLLTAERLYARLGIDGVSLREINREAQQKNRSAVHYHFGSREAVIDGIFEMRAAQIDARRRELLSALRTRGTPITLRELTEGLIRPQAEVWLREKGPYHYNRFLAQAALSGRDDLRDMWRKRFGASLQEYWNSIRELLPGVPDPLLRQRLAVAADFAIYGLASLEGVVESRRATKRPFPFERAIENLIDMLTASVAGPPSAATLAALAEEQQHGPISRRSGKTSGKK